MALNDVLRIILTKLTERSSIAAYVTITFSIFGYQSSDEGAHVASVVANFASLGLLAVNDKTIAGLFAKLFSRPVVKSQTPVVIPPKEEPPQMSTALLVIQLLISIIPLLSEFIKQVEAIIPNASGADKLKAVLATVETYLTKAGTDGQVLQGVLTQLEPLISGLVTMFNVTGIFSKAAPVMQPAPGPAAPVTSVGAPEPAGK